MRVPPPIKEFLAWRWAPCVALTAGSLAFVSLAVLVIPSQFDAARSAEGVSAFDHPASGSRAIYGASLAQGAALAQNAVAARAQEEAPQPQPRLRAQPLMAAAPQARGFSPPIERADPPPPPPAELMSPPPMPPAPPVPPEIVPAPPAPAPDADAPHREN